MTEKSRRLYRRLVRHSAIFKTELQKSMDRVRRIMDRTYICPVCAGKMSVEEVYQTWDDTVDRLLCKEHSKQLDEKANRRMEA